MIYLPKTPTCKWPYITKESQVSGLAAIPFTSNLNFQPLHFVIYKKILILSVNQRVQILPCELAQFQRNLNEEGKKPFGFFAPNSYGMVIWDMKVMKP